MNLEMGSPEVCGASLGEFRRAEPRSAQSRIDSKVNVRKYEASGTPADNREVGFVKLEVSRVETRRRNEQR